MLAGGWVGGGVGGGAKKAATRAPESALLAHSRRTHSALRKRPWAAKAGSPCMGEAGSPCMGEAGSPLEQHMADRTDLMEGSTFTICIAFYMHWNNICITTLTHGRVDLQPLYRFIHALERHMRNKPDPMRGTIATEL